MRNYKFRGNRKDNLGWSYGNVVQTKLGVNIVDDTKWYPVYPETVGQYIGVHDDEWETEIFEGDNIRMVHEGEVITGNVQYCGGGFILASDDFEDGFAWISDLTENDGRYFWIPNSEVISNRWDNPDLLGEVRE